MEGLLNSNNGLHCHVMGVRNNTTLLDSIPAGILELDSAGTCRFCNDHFAVSLGLDQNEIIGKNIDELLLKRGEDGAPEPEKIFENCDSFPSSCIAGNQGKEERLFSLKFNPLKGQADEITGFACLVQDITGKWNKERELTDRLNHFQMALDGSPYVLFSQDRDLRYTWIYNPAGDYETHSTIGKTDLDILPSDVASELVRIKKKALDSGERIREEVITIVSGVKTYYDITIEPVFDEGGSTIEIACVSADITERKRMEEEIVKSRELLNEMGRIAGIGAWEVDPDTSRAVWTDEIYRILELEPGSIPDVETGLSFYTPESRPAVKDALERAVSSGEPFDLDAGIITAEGTRKVVRAMGKAEQKGGKTVRVTGVLQDITEWKKISDEKIKANDALTRLLKEVNCLYRIVYHGSARGISLEDIFDRTVYDIIEAVQFPEKACAAIKFGDIFIKSRDYIETENSIKKEIVIDEKNAGYIEVCYPAGIELQQDTRFLKEELFFLDVVSQTLGRVVEKICFEKKLYEQTMILELAHDAIMVRDLDGRVVFWNRSAEKKYGWKEGEAKGRVIHDLLETVFPEPFEKLKERFEKTRFWEGELKQKTREGDDIIIESRWSMLYDEKNNYTGTLEVNRNITESRVLEERLMLSEYKYKVIFENTGNAFAIIDKNMEIEEVNRKFEILTGYERHEVEGKINLKELIQFPSTFAIDRYIGQSSDDNLCDAFETETILMDRLGEMHDISIVIDAIPESPFRIVSIIDLTERNELLNEIMTISEKERARIGRDIHDDLGQYLAGISLLSRAAANELKEKNVDEPQELRIIEETAGIAKSKIRSVVRGLTLSNIEEHGLPVALNELALDVSERFKINCSFSNDSAVELNDVNIIYNLYRIVNEAVNNAVAHAHPKNIYIALSESDDTICFSIRDDGPGIPGDVDLDSTMGMRIMDYRAKILGASLEVKSLEERGTEVLCSLSKDLL